ncbi:ANTAR domain-containing protein [Zavarzinia compransoris]|uniref:ANTAR domain-containing response regulator n=1 Tax=Zavarzinia marina TaxID=2911065 RepID=UPI001F42DA33|nr:ANTAR domain-containing protein [Zavarzinia marina]MCF4165220.1 ANTAR domain-containing protein [Zavarzinia marina]
MTKADIRILVIDDNRIRASIIEEGLREAGYSRVSVIAEPRPMVRDIVEADPDVVFIDLENPNRDVLEHMFNVSRAISRPIAMFVDRSDRDMIEAAVDAGVSAYIVDGLKKERLKPILETAISRFNAFSRMREELDRTRRALEERKVIDRAKGILMRQRGIPEDEAHALLRRTAMNENRRIADIAQSVITAADLLSGGKP